MEIYYLKKKENVSDKTFAANIKLAKKLLIEKNNLSEDSINQLRDRDQIQFSVDHIEYIGRLIEFEIKNESKVLDVLHCFKSDRNDCLEISTFQ